MTGSSIYVSLRFNPICISLLFLLLLKTVTGQAQQRPNILWITIEDTSPQFIGCYGNQNARTPVIDKLAEGGVRFINAFSSGTVCSPSRSTIITGVNTFKMGTGNHRSSYAIPDYIKGFPYYMQEQGYYVSNNSKTDYNVGNADQFTREAWSESSDKAGWWTRKPGQPFFAVFNFMDSHQSRTMTHPYDWYIENVIDKLPGEDRIADDAFEMPPFYKDSPEMRKYFARVYNSIKLTDNRIGELLAKLDNDNLRDSTIIFFFADHGEGIPRGKTNGINLGYRVPFVIWFPEMYKHLSPWGTGGVVTEELIDFNDLAPTLIQLTGGEIPEYMNGRVLLGENHSEPPDYLILSSDRADNGPDMVRTITNGKYIYSRNYMPFMPLMRYIRYVEIADITKLMRRDLANSQLNDIQSTIFTERPAEFLFDIENDLWEVKNQLNNPQYQELLATMRKHLDREVLNSRDIHFLPEYEIGLISKSRTAYEYRLDKTKYPLDEIYDVASLAGRRGVDIARQQVDFLQSKNRIIRYWAIIGLRSQSDETIQHFSRGINSSMYDSYLPVSVTAAAISYQVSGNTEAENMLKEYCRHENQDIALMTINYILYVENKQPFIETIKAVYELPGSIYRVKAACLDFLGVLKLVANDFEHRN
ncbi:MAG: sulfatase [Marinilabiliaceae bacterium]|jgi:arylsulfatase A-like enzyme|nr:sulfatase [Marinilabiliaceae bacterium]